MKPFMTCPNCGFIWPTRKAFLSDDNVFVVGYQVNFVDLKAGFFLFNHICGTTFTLDVRVFADLYHGPVFHERLTGGDSCPSHCLHSSNTEPCPAECECAYVREIIQILKNKSHRA